MQKDYSPDLMRENSTVTVSGPFMVCHVTACSPCQDAPCVRPFRGSGFMHLLEIMLSCSLCTSLGVQSMAKKMTDKLETSHFISYYGFCGFRSDNNIKAPLIFFFFFIFLVKGRFDLIYLFIFIFLYIPL